MLALVLSQDWAWPDDSLVQVRRRPRWDFNELIDRPQPSTSLYRPLFQMSVPPLSVNGQPSTASTSFDVAAGPIEPHRVLSIQSHVVSGYVGQPDLPSRRRPLSASVADILRF